MNSLNQSSETVKTLTVESLPLPEQETFKAKTALRFGVQDCLERMDRAGSTLYFPGSALWNLYNQGYDLAAKALGQKSVIVSFS